MPGPRLADPFYSVVDPSPFYRRRGKGYRFSQQSSNINCHEQNLPDEYFFRRNIRGQAQTRMQERWDPAHRNPMQKRTMFRQMQVHACGRSYIYTSANRKLHSQHNPHNAHILYCVADSNFCAVIPRMHGRIVVAKSLCTSALIFVQMHVHSCVRRFRCRSAKNCTRSNFLRTRGLVNPHR